MVRLNGRSGTIALTPVKETQRDHARRALNVVVAVVALVLTAPLMLLIAVLIKVTSRGPVLFTQPRVGLDRRGPHPGSFNWRRKVDYGGRVFRIYKFRTMYVNGHLSGNGNGAGPGQGTSMGNGTGTAEAQVWAQPGDPRVTPLGRFLRAYRLDELPQLVNVLKGDMNIVGPRPEQPEIVLNLREQIDRYPARQRVRPGITGLAQINQHYDRCLEDVKRKVDYDLEYIDRRSAMEDLRIMAATVPVVLFKKGAW